MALSRGLSTLGLNGGFANRMRYSIVPQMVNSNSPYKITKMPNGINVGLIPNPNDVGVMVRLLVKAGSRYQPKGADGLSYFLHRMGFKSTPNKTTQELESEFEDLGGVAWSGSDRSTVTYCGLVLRENSDRFLELFAESILDTVLSERDLEDQKNAAHHELMEERLDPSIELTSRLHQVAFKDEGLGMVEKIRLENLDSITVSDLKRFRSQAFVGNRITVSLTGLDKVPDSFAQKLAKLKPESETPLSTNRSQYFGGRDLQSINVLEPDEFGQPPSEHLMLGCLAPSSSSPDFVSTVILAQLLGGGASFSVGGPGKGMHSRLYREVLDRYSWVQQVSSSYLCYEDSGLFLLYFKCFPGAINHALHVLRDQLSKIHVFTPVEFSRAKNQVKAKMFTGLETKDISCDDLARQLLFHDYYLTPEQLGRLIDDTTLEQVSKTAQSLLKYPFTIVSTASDESNQQIQKFRFDL